VAIEASVGYINAALAGVLHAEALERSAKTKLAHYPVSIADDHSRLVAQSAGVAYHLA